MISWKTMLVALVGLSLHLGVLSQESERPHPGTRAMANLLAKLEKQLSVGTNPFANAARVESLENQIGESEDAAEQLRLRFVLGQEQLKAGRTEEGVANLIAVFSVIYKNRENVEEESLLEAWKAVGMGYLWHGELINARNNASTVSGDFPIAGAAIHMDDQGSRAAVRVYEALLKEYPDELGAVFLLNLAHMNVGEYPEKVPLLYRLPEPSLRSEFDLPRFQNVARRLGVDAGGRAGGVIMEDLNGDGLLDLMVSSISLEQPLRLFLHDGEGRIKEKGDFGLMGIGGGNNLLHADYDNDGDQDILVLRGGGMERWGKIPNSLLRNAGDGRFQDVTLEAGLFSRSPTGAATWGDFNRDGHLDLFVGNESMFSKNPDTTEMEYEANPCNLYLNLGNGKFRDVAEEYGLDVRGYIKSVAWADYDRDGYLDLFISQLRGENLLFRNLGPDVNGKWRFDETADVVGVSRPVDSSSSWFWDYNNDGWLDLFVSGYSEHRIIGDLVMRDVAIDLLKFPKEAERLWLYENNQDGTFSDVSIDKNLNRVAYTVGAGLGDLDNDGWLDFYLGTGGVGLSLAPNRMFRNHEGIQFQEVTTDGGFGQIHDGSSVAFGDLDNDGDHDIYSVIGGFSESESYKNQLFENPGNDHKWIAVKLVGTRSARDAIGAHIEVRVLVGHQERRIFAQVLSGESYGSAPYRRTIGLGNADSITELRVTWPGTTNAVSYGSVPTGKCIEIVEGVVDYKVLTHIPIEFN